MFRFSLMNIQKKLLNKRVLLPVIIGILIILMLIILVAIRSNTDNKTNNKGKAAIHKLNPDHFTYTFISASVDCRQVKPYPDATSTINYCDGKLRVTLPSSKEVKEYKVTSTTHLYRNGVAQELLVLPTLSANTMLSLTTFKGMDDQVSDIRYSTSTP
jgi:hypothetical protein